MKVQLATMMKQFHDRALELTDVEIDFGKLLNLERASQKRVIENVEDHSREKVQGKVD